MFLFIIGLSSFVRLSGLNEYDFTDDELWHLTVSNQPNIWEVVKYNFQQEVHPPLSPLIWHFALQISYDHVWLRMPGIVSGILLIPSIYLFGKLYIGRYAGYLLAFLFAFSPFLTAISESVRAYSFLMLALTWAAIYAHRYCSETNIASRRKSLILYFVCCFLAIELHHGACFAIFSLGLILIFKSIREKNKKDFVIISAIHAVLISLILGYLYILTAYYGFEGLAGYFSYKTVGTYALLSINNVLSFASGIYAGIIDIFSLLAIIATPILLIKNKKYLLLNIVFSPLAALIICDYFDFYPFSSTIRNNLFLFLSLSVIYAYFGQVLADVIGRRFQGISSKNIRSILLKICVILITFIVVKHLIDNNLYRNAPVICKEFAFKKSDRQILDEQIRKRNKEGNIFVTAPRNMWNRKLKSGDKNITILTDHLAKFEDEEIEIYFDSAYGLTHSVMLSMLDYQIFFKDLFEHLEKNGALSKVKSFTFFDTGLNAGYFGHSFFPQFIPPIKDDSKYEEGSFLSCKQNMVFELLQEYYNSSWAINSSNQVLDKFYHTDSSFSCGRNIYILSFTPKFVKDEILDKDYVNFRQLRDTKCVK